MNSSEIYRAYDGQQWRFNDAVEAIGCFAPIEQRSGRLVQVRKGTGPFGMNGYFIRKADGSLCHWMNVALRCYNGPLSEYLDEPGETYTILEEWPETGFVIENPKGPAHHQQSMTMMITKSSAIIPIDTL
jgi:hypothetical protein